MIDSNDNYQKIRDDIQHGKDIQNHLKEFVESVLSNSCPSCKEKQRRNIERFLTEKFPLIVVRK